MRLAPKAWHRETVPIRQPPAPAGMHHRHQVRRREPEILPPGRVVVAHDAARFRADAWSSQTVAPSGWPTSGAQHSEHSG